MTQNLPTRILFGALTAITLHGAALAHGDAGETAGGSEPSQWGFGLAAMSEIKLLRPTEN